jgi:hypothetical protein
MIHKKETERKYRLKNNDVDACLKKEVVLICFEELRS